MNPDPAAIEAQLAESENYIRAILRTTTDGFCVLTTQGRIVECNDAYVRMSGYTREELLTLAVPDLDVFQQPHETETRVRKILATGSDLFYTRHRRKDGNLFDLEVSATCLDADGGRILCFCRDITGHKQTEGALAARLRLLEIAASRSIAEIHQATLDEVEQLTGSRIGFYHHYDEESSRFFLQAWSTETISRFCQAKGQGLHYDLHRAGVWADCIRQRRPVVHNDFAATPERRGMPPGHAEVVRELVVPVFREGKIVAVLGVGNKATPYTQKDIDVVSTLADLSWDIAVRRMAEEALITARDRAEEASRAKSEFLANVSHEIRTPMTVILVALEHLSLAFSEPDQRALLDLAENSADRLLNRIDDLLDFSRIEARRIPLDLRSFDLRAAVGDAVDLFRMQAVAKAIDLQLHLAPDLPPRVSGDAGRLGQVLVNLLGNALKFTDRGMIRIAAAPAGSETVRFSVADTGIGIPPAKQERIFESFYQVDSSLTRKHGGTGLGLSISRGLVELMGGTIGVRSREGRGSTFFFTLPLPAAADAAGSDSSAALAWPAALQAE